MLETTDPHLAGGKLVALADDRRLQPGENVVPVVRRTFIDAYGPAFIRILDSVGAQPDDHPPCRAQPARRHRRRAGGTGRRGLAQDQSVELLLPC